jgi:hypothetical protein
MEKKNVEYKIDPIKVELFKRKERQQKRAQAKIAAILKEYFDWLEENKGKKPKKTLPDYTKAQMRKMRGDYLAKKYGYE